MFGPVGIGKENIASIYKLPMARAPTRELGEVVLSMSRCLLLAQPVILRVRTRTFAKELVILDRFILGKFRRSSEGPNKWDQNDAEAGLVSLSKYTLVTRSLFLNIVHKLSNSQTHEKKGKLQDSRDPKNTFHPDIHPLSPELSFSSIIIISNILSILTVSKHHH